MAMSCLKGSRHDYICNVYVIDMAMSVHRFAILIETIKVLICEDILILIIRNMCRACSGREQEDLIKI